MTRRIQHAGFTLLEVVTAIALLGLLTIGLLSMSLVVRESAASIEQRVSGAESILATRQFIGRAVEQAIPPVWNSSKGRLVETFVGTAHSMTLLSTGVASAAQPGLYEVKIHTQGEGTGDLNLVAEIFLPSVGSPDTALHEVLLEGIEHVSFQYRGVDANVWQSDWQGKGELPASVRVVVGFRTKDRRHWQELVAGTLRTAPAQCEFDVIALKCRRI